MLWHIVTVVNKRTADHKHREAAETSKNKTWLAVAVQRMNLAVYPPCWTVPLNPRRSVHPNRLHGGRTQHPSRCSVQTSHSPGAAGLCKCQFSRRWDGSYWWKHKDLWILPSWARRPGTPEEAWTRPAVAGSSFRDDPLLSWTGAGNRLVNRQRWCCAVWWFFFFFFPFIRNPVCFAEGLGGSQSSSTREEAAYTHRACT